MKTSVFGVILLVSFLSLANFSSAQVVAAIDGEAIGQDEFLYAFKKNRKENEPINRDSLEAYLNQFINFKLKVRAARALGLDTSLVFQNELEGYISQIRKPYLEDDSAEETLSREIYARMQSDINASHILLKLDATASPSDTLKAYSFLDSLKQTIGSKQEFEEMARRFSQDGSARNGGNLGWFTAMHMVAPFEEGAYKTAPGKVSDIVRSSFGYHLIFVNDKRQNRGKIKTSHIFFTKQRGREEAFQRAQMVYDSLKNGGDWSTMVSQFSDDNGTKYNDGSLPWAGIKQLPDDFLDIAHAIDTVGEYTKPKETQFGWHIVKLEGLQPLEPYEIKKTEIAQLLKRMGRNNLAEEALLKKLKEENNFSQDAESLNSIIDEISQASRSTAYESELKERVIFTHGQNQVRTRTFLESLPGFNVKYTRPQLIEFYRKFEKDYVIAYEDSIAPEKYPEFGFLMNEYEEGLLLFEVMQRKVWDKAAQDSLGLQAYYQNHLNRYVEGERVECLCTNNKSEQLRSELSELFIPLDSLPRAKSYISKEMGDSKTEELNFAKRTLLVSDLANFEMGKSQIGKWFEPSSLYAYCLVQNILPEGPQQLNEIKGIVMSDYQEELDSQWIEELRDSAKIKINNKVLKAISNR